MCTLSIEPQNVRSYIAVTTAHICMFVLHLAAVRERALYTGPH